MGDSSYRFPTGSKGSELKFALQYETSGFNLQGMKRSYEELLGRYLEIFPCVVVVGVRQSGKTTLIRTLPEGWVHYDLERQADQEVVSRDPDAFFRLHPRQVALDEAQLVPGIFPALRVAIDEARDDKGRYVVTGSSSPELLRSVSESLAGRVGVIELAPFSWEEVTATGERESLVGRLADRRISPAELVAGLGPRADVAQAHDFWFRGGFPEPWLNPGEEFRRLWVEQYLQAYVYRDVRRLFPGLDEVRYRRFVGMLGGLSGKVLNYAEVARALQVSQPTVRDYFEIAHGTFVWRRVPAFTRDAVKRVVKHPKGYLRDSGLLHSLLRIPDMDALLSHPQMGASWEGMVVEEILRHLNTRGIPHQYSHYRTGGGAEVDLVIEGDFGLVPVEIKHTSNVRPRDLRSLGDFVVDHKARLGVVVNNDCTTRLYTEKLVGIPFHWL
jgi:predicted AAA+ superfamily ATPase